MRLEPRLVCDADETKSCDVKTGRHALCAAIMSERQHQEFGRKIRDSEENHSRLQTSRHPTAEAVCVCACVCVLACACMCVCMCVADQSNVFGEFLTNKTK